jgi:MFS transporter, DHA1 family, tetracycline resistance protein
MSPIHASAIVVFCEGLVLWAYFPIMSFRCGELGGDAAWVGMLFALLSLPRILTNPVFGTLSDRYGRRPLLALASIGTLLGSVVWALSTDLHVLAVSRLIAGLFAAQSTLSFSIVADTLPPAKRATGMGLLGASFGISMVLGPLLSDITVRLTHSFAAVGWFAALVQFISVVTIVFFLRETRASGGAAQVTPGFDPRRGWRATYVQRSVLMLFVVSFLIAGTMMQVITTIGELLQHHYGFDSTHVSYLFTGFGLIGVAVQGGLVRWAVPRWGERATTLAGLFVTAIGFALLAAIPALWLALVGAMLLGCGTGLSMPTVTALVSRSVPEEQQGGALGAQQSMFALGRGIAAGVAGLLFQKLGPGCSYGIAVAMSIIAIIVLWLTPPPATSAPTRGLPVVVEE